MKRLSKIFVNLFAVLMLTVACFSAVGCVERITKLNVKVQVYNSAESKMEEVTLKVKLYGHLAENTVNSILDRVNGGYYNDAVFYKNQSQSNQIMLGDIVEKDGAIALNSIKAPAIGGEFERAGVVGSNLKNVKGAIGLWRSWYEKDSYSTSDDAMHSGEATWYMPTESITGYDGWFCVFAMLDMDDQDTADAFELIISALDGDTEDYQVYYTGEYDSEKADEDYGLTVNLVASDLFDEEDYFEPEGAQLVKYQKRTVNVPVNEGVASAKVLSITVA